MLSGYTGFAPEAIVIVGSDSIRVIAGQEALDNFRQSFRPKEIISYSPDLAEICLLVPFGAERLGEIATAMTAQLTLNRISPVGILVCPTEDIIIVSEADASRTFEALLVAERGNPEPQSRGPRLEEWIAEARKDSRGLAAR